MTGQKRRSACARTCAAAGLILALGMAACSRQELPEGLYARIYTAKGVVLARLEPDLTPLAVSNFVGLAEGTIENAAFDLGRPFYDGTVIHRVEPGHVVQMGIPASDRADGPGYVFPNEIHASLSHDHAGALNFANRGPHTNASQWCITLGDRSYLDGDYIVFGNVVRGMDVVFSLARGDVVDSVRIERLGERARAFHPDTRSFQRLVETAQERVAEQAVLKREAERAWIQEHYPELAGPGDSVRSVVLNPGTGSVAPGPLQLRYQGIRVRYLGHLLGYDGPPIESRVFGSREDGTPDFVETPLPFPFEPGITKINPGLDAVLAAMTPGERRRVLVPPESAYGRSGLYPPETPGKPRFVIGPNTLLVYEVELMTAGREGVNRIQ